MKVTPAMVAGLSNTLLQSSYDDLKQTPDFHFEVWELCCEDHPKVAIAAPRGHAKSSAVTFAYLLSVILWRERDYAVIVSETEGQSKQFLHDFKKIILTTASLRQLFKVKGFSKETETDVIIEFEDGHEARVVAKGSGQSVRGMKWNSKRPDIIICDDLEGDEQVMNEDRREKFRRWFFGALLPMMSDDGIIRVVGTIMHLDALLERLMPENQFPPQMKLREPYLIIEPCKVTSTYPGRIWKSVRYAAHNEDFSHILWPAKFSKERLLEIRTDYVQQGLPDGYAQEYLNYPIDSETAYFKQEYLKPVSKLSENCPKYIGVDLAVSQQTRANKSSFVVGQMNSANVLQIIDNEVGRFDSLEIIDTIFALHIKYRPEFFVIEKGPIWSALEPLLIKTSMERGISPEIKTYPATQDKLARARTIQGRMRVGLVEFLKETSWYPSLESELLRFPKGASDDIVDSLAWLGIALAEMVSALTETEIDDIKYNQVINFHLTGASEITGY